MNKHIVLLLFLLQPLLAKNNMPTIDKYHDVLCQILVDTSNDIDNYFVEGNSTKSSTTRAELSNSFAIENHQNIEKDIRLRLRLSLPRIQKNLHLIFEDETKDNSLYDGTRLSNERLEEKKYYLRLEYLKFVKEKLNIAFAGGVRIRHVNLIPYANIRFSYNLYDKESVNSSFYNRFRYYSDGVIEDTFEFDIKYSIDDLVDLFLRNELSYSNKYQFQTAINDISLIKNLNNEKQIGVGFGVVSELKNFKDPHIDYAHFHLLFHHMFYKDWIYYQVAPSLLWRESNEFKSSYRVMINFGILFDSD